MSISTCALREEGDPAIIKITASHSGFLSTPSARRATVSFCWFPKTANYFYPHPPRGGRQYIDAHLDDEVQFLSTPSARRATGEIPRYAGHHRISIHALREEGDAHHPNRRYARHNFYPRPPRGGRLTVRSIAPGRSQFLSTPSARRATRSQRPAGVNQTNFYPRPPRGGRQYIDAHLDDEVQFLSTPSARRATQSACTSCTTA